MIDDRSPSNTDLQKLDGIVVWIQLHTPCFAEKNLGKKQNKFGEEKKFKKKLTFFNDEIKVWKKKVKEKIFEIFLESAQKQKNDKISCD